MGMRSLPSLAASAMYWRIFTIAVPKALPLARCPLRGTGHSSNSKCRSVGRFSFLNNGADLREFANFGCSDQTARVQEFILLRSRETSATFAAQTLNPSRDKYKEGERDGRYLR